MVKAFVLIALLNTGPYIVLTTPSIQVCEGYQKYLDTRGTVSICVEKDPKQDMLDFEVTMQMVDKLVDSLHQRMKRLEKE